MFTINKYSKWYFSIINTAKTRVRQGYTERHHILPKSLGGTNETTNLVDLTAREHFICHKLLPRMVTGEARRKMSFALWIINNKANQQNTLTGRAYEMLRLLVSEAMCIKHTGRSVSPETRAKQSASKKMTHNTPEVRAKISAVNSNRTAEHRAKLGAAHKGKTISAEHRARNSAALSGANNARALQWEIAFEDSRPSIRVSALKDWCEEQGIKYLGVYHRAFKPTGKQHLERKFYEGVHATLINT